MSIFSKLFGKNTGASSAAKKQYQDIFNATPSVNYQVSCNYLRMLFFAADVPTAAFRDNIDFAKKLVDIAVQMCSKKGVLVPSSYYNLPVTYVFNHDRNCYGYIVEFDDAAAECDCNYIGMMIMNGVKVYYTSEYYASADTFDVCCFRADGSRLSGIGEIYPRTFEEFKRAIIG